MDQPHRSWTRRAWIAATGGAVVAAGVLRGATVPSNDGASRLIYTGPGGRLAYRPYTREGDVLPDFSNCGFGGGGVAIPDVAVRLSMAPVRGSKDERARIQAAIDEVSRAPADARGWRGAVLLKRGRYAVDGSLRLHTSGVVLRGEGAGEDGTVLVATRRAAHTLIVIQGGGGAVRVGPRVEVANPYVPVGARGLELAAVPPFRAGDTVAVHRPGTEAWIRALGMDRIPRKENTVQWAAADYHFQFERVVTAVQGRRILFDAPLVNALQREYGGGAVQAWQFTERIRQTGVEYLRGESVYRSPEDEEHGWVFIAINHAQHAWVRGVTSRYFGYACVQVGRQTRWVTVQDCACLDPMSLTTGGRKYSFGLNGQLGLCQRCRTRGGRHDYVQSSRVPGPNVFLDSRADQAKSDSGPHHRWAMGTLFDNIVVNGHELNVQDRGNSGSGHGWSGAQMVFWNCQAKRIICQQPPTAQNFAIGCRGERSPGWHPRPAGWWESHGHPVRPASLYLRQLADRLGAQALRNMDGPGPVAE